MTPKEKAEELIISFSNILFDEVEGYYQRNHIIKLCALLMVDKIRDNTPLISDIQQYWINVKSEIEKL